MAGELLYGFHQLKDILGNRLDDQNIPVVNDAITQAVEERNRQLNTMLSAFVTRTTEAKVRYKQLGAARNQPLDQNGRALPIKPAGFYDVALPIQMSGSAWGTNYVTRQLMTVQDANDATRVLLDGDTAWMRDHVLAALVAAATWTFPDEEKGDLTIQPLANGDAVTYQLFTGATSNATDNHLLAQTDPIDDTHNPFRAIHRELLEHPENGGQVFALVASDLRDDIEALDVFREQPDVNIELGANSDRVVGRLGIETPGTVFGYVSGVFVVEWASLPSGYMICGTTQGQRPIAQREYPVASLQGFHLAGTRDDHPFYESQYLRVAGFGGWNRVGALVYQVGAGSYSVPTGYASPMP
jgi:hypothetical protein